MAGLGGVDRLAAIVAEYTLYQDLFTVLTYVNESFLACASL
jgi:hypothetical protein